MGIWVLAVLSMAWGLFGGYDLFQLDIAYDRLDSSLYIAFYRFFWSLGIVWIIVACSTGNGGELELVNILQFTSSSVYNVYGNLSSTEKANVRS